MKQTREYEAKIYSSLTKIFLEEEPQAEPEIPFTALRGETFSFVVSYTHRGWSDPYAFVRLESPIKECYRIREVCQVPSVRPANANADADYLRKAPGLYPDLLTDLSENRVQFWNGKYKSLWVDVEIPADVSSGLFPIDVVFVTERGDELCRAQTMLQIGKTVLPKAKLIHTEWFHGDCLADYYRVPVFSERHWEIMEAFIRTAAKRGCNMILTPQFTPPLDTAPGGERTTIQLVEVFAEADGSYRFGFERMQRWVELCLRCGMRYFEMSHLFTQWGAAHAPKVMGYRDGVWQQLFGWEDDAVGGRYTKFLQAYLPCLVKKLEEWGIKEQTRFHISDEPGAEHLASYRAARESVAEYLKDFVIMDAISDLEICRQGGIDCPVCANDHMTPFLEAGIAPLWSYYCTSQGALVSNRFMAMPSVRNRIFGIQAFLYGLEGILHWGYNFYNSQYSVFHLNPYQSTDANGAFPSGDPFLVYPGPDGRPEESIRLMVQCHMMQDVSAMELLEKRMGREYVRALLQEGTKEKITFTSYPKSASWLLSVRNRINEALEHTCPAGREEER